MNYQNLVKDFALRTRDNLNALRELKNSHPNVKVFEVTQLINSMLGLLVLPQQRCFQAISERSISDMSKEGWPTPKVEGKYRQVTGLRQFLRYLRNAIAHFNVEFRVSTEGQINGLVVWNVLEGKVNWRASLSLEDIEKITEKLSQLVIV